MESNLFEALADRWNPEKVYAGRPAAWVKDIAQEHLWSAQNAIAESVAHNRYTAVYSAHDLGKSKIAADLIAWWIDSHPPGEAFVVSTAPTAAQVSAVMWREVSKLHTRVHLPGHIARSGYPTWYVGNELVGYGRKPADYQDSAFQGIHAKYVLVVIDEACGVIQHLFDSVNALVTNEFARVLAIGNPTDSGSYFATTVCSATSNWNVIQLDGLRSPNMTKAEVIGHKSEGYGYENPRYPLTYALMRAEGIPFSTEVVPDNLKPLLLAPLWIEERIREWCGFTIDSHLGMSDDELQDTVRRRTSQSAIFMSRARGQFPTGESTGIIPMGWITAAVNRWKDIFDPNGKGRPLPPSLRAVEPGRKIVGIDVAGGGEDETVFAIRYGNIISELHKFTISDTMEIVDNAAVHLHEPGAVAVVDGQGIGSGVYSALKRYHEEGKIIGKSFSFIASAQSGRRDSLGQFRFRNDRSAAWWNMRELLDPSKGSMIALPDDERLIGELATVRWKENTGGIIQAESKDEIRKRIGRSTDSADAVIQAFWVRGNPAAFHAPEWGEGGTSGVVTYDGYDPFTDRDFFSGPGLSGGGNRIDRDWSGRSTSDRWGL